MAGVRRRVADRQITILHGGGVPTTPQLIPSDLVGGSTAVFPRDPFGARAFFTPPLLPTTVIAGQEGVPYVPPPDPYGARAFGVYFAPPPPPPTVARQSGIPFVPPPDPYGASAFFTAPLLPTTRFAAAAGNRAVFPPDPYGAQAFGTYFAPPKFKFGQAGSGPVFPPDPFGAQAFFTPPLLPTVVVARAAGNSWIFPPEPFGAQAFQAFTGFIPPPPKAILSAGNRAVFEPDPFGARSFFVAPLLPTRNYAARQVGTGYLGPIEVGFSGSFWTKGTFTIVVVEAPGGGGFGADMSGRFTDRYTDKYDDRYDDRYQETFRIQR